ncbi:CynX/NimT family MFS transporter [Tianweitania sp. BSSL-BM11]|uniref:CynX/NimT family MFS transporter n=1 Tax=Tianweitania aestuarii TaxID=2814886 RepID=A0ABS5RV05_9HYPH|nr:CynX/NimT family MFS transporter [Tianweitania aestuarii]MBS9720885.1 CynX/NimT family MFS transporter [Tianweitania aestuarii]
MTQPSSSPAASLDASEITLIDAQADDAPAPLVTPVRSTAARFLLGLSLVLIAANLRPVFSSLSSILPEVVEGAGLSTTSASVLTTLPVVCLGLFAPMAPRLAQRFGAERVLLAVLLFLAVGTGLRGTGYTPILFFGTVLAGAAIATGNVLLPGLVKRDFPDRAAMMTGLYTMALCAGASAAAGITVPVEHAWGSWQIALAIWALPALLVACLWAPQTVRLNAAHSHKKHCVEGLWRDPLAWQVTVFMGLQSAFAYIVFGWLSPILRERGLDAATAGLVVSTDVMVQVAACLVIPSIAIRCRDQRAINTVLISCAMLPLLGFIFAPLWMVWILAVVQGIGQGGLIAVAMTMIMLRSPDARVASYLSGMAQGGGYVIASLGPLLVGLIHSWTGSFVACAWLIVLIGAGAITAGLGAGRARHVQVRQIEV